MQDRKYDWSGIDFPGLDEGQDKDRNSAIERERQKRARDQRDLELLQSGKKPTLGETVSSMGRAFAGGLGSTVTGAPVTPARMLEAIFPEVVADPRHLNVRPGEGGEFQTILLPNGGRVVLPKEPIDTREKVVRERPSWVDDSILFLDSLAKEATENLPKPDPRLEGSFWATDVPQAFGSALGFMAAGAAGGALGMGTTLPVAASGAMAEGGGMYLEAEAKLAEQVAQGKITPEEAKQKAFTAWAFGFLALGPTEAVPMGNMLARLDRRWRGALSDVLKASVFEAFEEGVQEAGQQLGEGLVIDELTGEDRGLMQRLSESARGAGAGAIVGAFLSLGVSAMNRAQRAARYRELTQLRESRQAEAQTMGLPPDLIPPPQQQQGGAPDLEAPPAPSMEATPAQQAFEEQYRKEHPETAPEQPPAEPAGGAPAAGPGAAEPAAAPSGVEVKDTVAVKDFVDSAVDVARRRGQAVPEGFAEELRQSAVEDTESPLARFLNSLGARLILVGKPGAGRGPVEGRAFPDAVVMDRNLPTAERARMVFQHETLGHFAKTKTPEAWQQTRDDLEALAPDLMAAWRADMEDQRGGLGFRMSSEIIEEEWVARAAEESVGFTWWLLRNREQAAKLLEEARSRREAEPGRLSRVLRWFADVLRHIGRRLGMSRGTLDYQLALLSHTAGVSEFEKESPEAALELADRFGRLVDALVARASQAAQEAAESTQAEQAPQATRQAPGPGARQGAAPSMADTIREGMAAEKAEMDRAEAEMAREPTAEELLEEQPQGPEEEPAPTSQAPSPAPAAPIEAMAEEAAEALSQRSVEKASRLHRELAKELGVPPGESLPLEQAKRKQLVRASRQAGIRLKATRVADMRTELADILGRGYRALEGRVEGLTAPEAIARQAEEAKFAKDRQRQERSQAARERMEKRVRALREGTKGDFRSFVQAWGGVSNPRGNFEAFTAKEIGERPAFGLPPVAHPKGSEKGTDWETLATTAIEVGYFPGRTSADFTLDDFIEALSGNPPAPGVAEDEYARMMEEEERREQERYETWLETATPEELDAWERKQDDVPFSLPRDPTGRIWFSAVSEAIKGMPQAQMQPRQFMDWLNKQPGVTLEEIDYLALAEYVDGRERVLKEDVLDYVREHRVEVQERVLGEPSPRREELERAFDEAYRRHQGMIAAHEPPQGVSEAEWDAEIEEARKDMEAARAELTASGGRPEETQYAQWTLPGGEENFELLLTLPVGQNAERDAKDRRVRELIARRDRLRAEYEAAPPGQERQRLTTLIGNTGRQIDMVMAEPVDRGTRTAFTGTHFPGTHNLLAWFRANKRAGPAGERVLFIEEIQSDWHQKGREKGYAGSRPADALVANLKEKATRLRADAAQVGERVYDALRSSWGRSPLRLLNDTGGRVRTPDDARRLTAELARYVHGFVQGWPMWAQSQEHVEPIILNYVPRNLTQDYDTVVREAMLAEADVAAEESRADLQGKPVPDAPFKTSWHSLALKRAIKWAVDNGFDSVAWTTGQQQFERWGSEEIAWVREGPSEWRVDATEQRGGQAGGIDIEGEARARGLLQEGEGYKVESIDDLKRIIKATLREASDQRIDKLANRVWARMQTEDAGVSLPRKEGMEAFYDTALPQAADKLGKRYGAKTGTTGIAGGVPLKSLRVASDGTRYWLEGRDVGDVARQVGPTFSSASEAMDYRANISGTSGEAYDIVTAHFIDLPLPMREAIAGRGFSTFAPKFSLAAWSGGPAKHRRFRTKYIGTGEGALAYGWGLYFSSRRAVAEWYRNRLEEEVTAAFRVGRLVLYADGAPLNYSPRDSSLAENVRAIISENLLIEEWQYREAARENDTARLKQLAIDAVEQQIETWKEEWPEAVPEAESILSSIRSTGVKFKRKTYGALYNVTLDFDEDVLLDWDTPLAEQPAAVRKAILSMLTPATRRSVESIWQARQEGEYVDTESRGYKAIYDDIGDTGYDFYNLLASALAIKKYGRGVYTDRNEDYKLASKWLLRRGVRGIRYRDGISRGLGDDTEGTHNYVVFDDRDITINERLSLPRGPAQMPEEEGLFGGVEKEARKPAPKPESKEHQAKLFDTGEGDLPGQRLLEDYLDEDRPKGGQGSLFSLPASTPMAYGASFAQRDEGLWRKINRTMLYDFAPVADLIEELREAGQEVTATEDVARAEERYYGKRANDVQQVRRRQRRVIRLMRRKGIKLVELDDYLRALHAPQRNEAMARRHPFTFDLMHRPGAGADSQGRPLNPGTIQDILDRVAKDPRAEAFKQAAAIVHEVNQEALGRRVGYGLLSAAGRDEWVRQFGDAYVPLRDAEDAGDMPSTFRVGRGYQVPRRLSQRAEGRTSTSGSPTLWSFAQAEAVASQARRNEVALAMAALVRAHPIPSLWRVSDVGLTTEQQKPLADGGPYSAFHFKERGDDRFIVLSGQQGQRIYNALTKMDTERAGLLIRVLGGIGRKFKQLATQWNPGFILRNMVKDLPTAVIRTWVVNDARSAARVAWNLRKAQRAVFRVLQAEEKGDFGPTDHWAQLYRQFREDGAETGYTALFGYSERVEDMEKALARGAPAEVMRSLWKAFENAQQAIEVATRLTVYDAVIKAGKGRAEAAHQAKNVTVNFNRKGSLGPAADALYWFYNPSVQGTRMVLKTINTPKGYAAFGGIVSIGFLMSMLNRFMGEDDDRNRWDETSPWIKNGYGQVLLPEEVELKLPFGGTIKVDRLMAPLAWGWNIPYVMGTQLAETIFGSTRPEEALGQTLAAVTESFNPMGASPTVWQFMTPSLADPFLQVAENTSFTGSKIHPTFYPGKSPSEAYWDDVPGYARFLTDMLNKAGGGNKREPGDIMGYGTSYSPESLDHLVRAYMGGLGAFGVRSVQFATDVLTGEDVAMREVPIVRSFVGESDTRTLQGQFFRAYNEVNTTRLVVERDKDKPKHPALYKLAGEAKKTKDAVDTLMERGDQEAALTRMRRFLTKYRRLRNE